MAVIAIIDPIEAMNCPWIQACARMKRARTHDTSLAGQTNSSNDDSRLQSNGSAEATVKTVKTLVRRLSVHAGLDERWWAHAALDTGEVLSTRWLGLKWVWAACYSSAPRATSCDLLVGDEMIVGRTPVSVSELTTPRDMSLEPLPGEKDLQSTLSAN